MGNILDLSVVNRQHTFTRTVVDNLDEFDHLAILDAATAQVAMVKDWLEVGRQMSVNVILGLYTIRKLWGKLGMSGVEELYQKVPWCGRNEYNGSFEQFVWKAFDVKPVTARNWIRVVDTWFIKPVTLASGEEFDAKEVAPSKLLLCTARQKDGEMRPEDYEALADPDVTWDGLRQRLIISDGNDKPMTSRVVILEGGLLWVKNGKEPKIPFGELAVDSENSLVQWGIEKVIRGANVKVRG